MQKKLICLALGAAALAPAISMADAQVYGRVDVSLDMNSQEVEGDTTEDNFELESNASRLGFKGSKELDNGWTAHFKMEYGVDVDDGDGTFSQRSIYGAIKTNFGELLVGKQDTPGKKAQGKLDLFGDHTADFNKVTTNEIRPDNLIQYTSPKLADAIKLKVALIPGEGSGADGATGADEDNGLADASSISAAYSSGPIYAAVAIDSDLAKSGIDDRTIFALGYKMDNLKLGFLYETGESNDGNTESTAFALSAGLTVGKNLFKAQYLSGEKEVNSLTDKETSVFALGVDHKLAKKTKGYVEFTSMSEDVSDTDTTKLAVGFQHNF